MADVKLEDNTVKVKAAINDRVNAALEECAGELESQVKRNTRVDTYQLKSSWTHKVDEDKSEAVVGSALENAIWEEFGTGEYALHGDGRKGGWKYQDMRGKWHFTLGKTPSRALWNAFTALKAKIVKRIEDSLKGL